MEKHDQHYIKQQNKQWVFNIVRNHAPLSRPDIVKKTGMSPTSISRIVYIIASGKTPGFSCGDESERQTREGSFTPLTSLTFF
jgi:hypothetical protein